MKSLPVTLGQLTGQTVSEEDFADNRLSIALKYLSEPRYWHPIEEDLARQTIRAYLAGEQLVQRLSACCGPSKA